MSWKDRYVRDLVITTGDGETFTVYTLPSFTKEVEYHVADFDFVNIDLPLIKRRKVAKREIPLEFFFINEDHIEEAKSFEFSAANEAPWLINHPYYDNILVQVNSIKFDDSDGNLTKITCIARETITDGGITVKPNYIDTIQLQAIGLNALMTVEPDITPTVTEINTVNQITEKNYKTGVKIITDPFDAEAYFNAFNTATSYVNTITATPILAIQALTNIILLPSQFQANVKDRIRVLSTQLDNLHRTIFGITSVSAKKLFAIQSISTLASMCNAAATPLGQDYVNATVATVIAGQINSAYRTFRADIDALQGANGGNPENFVPDFNSMRELHDLINFTTASLFEIALNGRKEFIFVLPENTSHMLLTHRFLGLDSEDENINDFISNNNISAEEIVLGLPKGRTVFYYA